MAATGRPLFSIGAVSRMVDLTPATIRTWETRYGLVTPIRSAGGQRLYSRDQVDQLRFVKQQVAAGRRPGEAHRLLSERISRGDGFGGTRMRVLRAETLVVIDMGDAGFDELSERLSEAGTTILPIELEQPPVWLDEAKALLRG